MSPFTDFKSFADWIVGTIVNPLIPVLFGIALVAFLYGVFLFIASSANEKARESGRLYIMYGLVGLFVMLSVWGLVAILTGTIGLGTGGLPQFQ